MARPGPANDEERLPWLEPYRDAGSAKARPKPKAAAPMARGGILVAAAGVAILVAAGGGYLIGQRDPAPVSVAPTTEVPVRSAPSAAPLVTSAPAPAASASAARAAAPVVRTANPVKIAQARPHRDPRPVVRQRKIRTAGIESAQIRAVRAAQEHRPPPPSAAVPAQRTAYRPWPKMPSPGPAGQVIQLGAFRSPTGANHALRSRLARYPALGRMPRVVVPVITRPRGEILYVLRLGTTSRQQSAIVCKNLRASGDHCLVIG